MVLGWFAEAKVEDGIVVKFTMCSLQVSEEEMSTGVCIRPLLPTGPATKVCKCAQGVWSEQRHQIAERVAPIPAWGRRQFLGLWGRHASARSGLWLRRRHISSAAPTSAAANGSKLCKIGTLQISEPGDHSRPRGAHCGSCSCPPAECSNSWRWQRRKGLSPPPVLP